MMTRERVLAIPLVLLGLVALGHCISTKSSQVVDAPTPINENVEEAQQEEISKPTEEIYKPILKRKFSSRIGGFKPSYDYANYAAQHTNNIETKIKYPSSKPKRKTEIKAHSKIKSQPTLLKLSEKDSNDSIIVLTTEALNDKENSKYPRIYYDQVSPSFRVSASESEPEISNGERGRDEGPHDHRYHKSVPRYNSGKNKDDMESTKFYYPKNYLGKLTPPDIISTDHPITTHHHHHTTTTDSIVDDDGRSHHDDSHSSHSSHGHSDHDALQHHAIELGFDYGLGHHSSHEGYHNHHHNGHHHNNHHHYGFIRDAAGHKIDAIGKALQVLIPSALVLTGISALFPNRVHVATDDTTQRRDKRSVHGPNHFDDDHPSKFMKNPFLQGNRMPRMPADFGTPPYGHGPPFVAQEDPTPPSQVEPLTHPMEYDGFYFEPTSYNFDPPPTFGPQQQQHHHDDEEHHSHEENHDPTMSPPLIMTSEMPSFESTTDASNEFDSRPREGRMRHPTRRPYSRGSELPVRTMQKMRKTTTATPFLKAVQHSESNNIKRGRNFNQIYSHELRINHEPEHHHDSHDYHHHQASQESPDTNTLQYIHSQEDTQKHDAEEDEHKNLHNVDLSPDGPVIGLIRSYATYDKDSPQCHKRALCDLAMKGSYPHATKFESFLWSLASLVPDQFSHLYDLEDIFHAIKAKDCQRFECANPDHDLQERK